MANKLYSGSNKFLQFFNGANYTIKDIHCDREFKPLIDKVKDDINVNMEYPPVNDHVPEAEQNSRVIG